MAARGLTPHRQPPVEPTAAGVSRLEPRTREFHVARWTWDAERCVEAIRDWTRTGSGVPRVYDWGLTQPQLEQLGLPNTGRALWEQHYPRWPSAATVAKHCGGFRAGLAAAGVLTDYSPVELDLQERVEAARRMRQAGLSRRDVADALAVSTRTVRAYEHAVACEQCASWVTSGRSVRCRGCRA